jgi:hypothetical protein
MGSLIENGRPSFNANLSKRCQDWRITQAPA